jgi:hypothetical protein
VRDRRPGRKRQRRNGEAKTKLLAFPGCRRAVPAVYPSSISTACDIQSRSGVTLYEAAAQAVTIFEREGWAADALTTTVVLDVEVILPSVRHQVPLTALRKWLVGPTTSPRAQAIKRSVQSRD